jgi:hypothetical protein
MKLEKQHDVFYYGEGYSGYNKKLTVKDIIKKQCSKNTRYYHDILLEVFTKFSWIRRN